MTIKVNLFPNLKIVKLQEFPGGSKGYGSSIVTTVAWNWSLTLELLHAMDVAKKQTNKQPPQKKQKKKKKENSVNYVSNYVVLGQVCLLCFIFFICFWAKGIDWQSQDWRDLPSMGRKLITYKETEHVRIYTKDNRGQVLHCWRKEFPIQTQRRLE